MFYFYIIWGYSLLGSLFFPKKIYFYAIGIVLVIFSGLRGLDVSRDTLAYYDVFTSTQNISDILNNSSTVNLEIWFKGLSYLFNVIGLNFSCLLIALCCLAIYINFKQYNKYAPFAFIAIIVYVSNFYLMHEMVQIRAGLASAVYLIAIQYLSRSKLKYFLLCSLAAMVHVSFLVTIPIYFLINGSVKRLNIYASLCILLFLSNILEIQWSEINLNINWAQSLTNNFEYINFKLNEYTKIQSEFHKIGLVNIFRLIIILFTVYIIYTNNISNYFFIQLTQLYLLGIIFFYAFFDYEGLSIRLSEIFFTVEPLVMSFFCFIVCQVYFKKIKGYIFLKIAFLSIFLLMWLLVFISNLNSFEPYAIF
jgi:hypothetical protein